VLYVGTDSGLYTGEYNGTNWLWAPSVGMPDTLVTDIKAHVNAAGANGSLYASTYGRGVYERIFVGPANLAARPSRAPVEGNTVSRCQVRQHDSADLQWSFADVEVEYTYSGTPGGIARLRPVVLADGGVSPYFVREVRDVVSGTHTTNLQVIYGAADAPLGLTTTGLQVEMFIEGAGSSFLVSDCPFVKTWRRDNARVLEVRSLWQGEGSPLQPAVPITLVLSSGAVETHLTPFTLVLTQGVGVSLTAPPLAPSREPLLAHLQWYLLGHGLEARSTSFAFGLFEDQAAIARYQALENELWVPLIRR
jgi:hypothetical protein